MKHIKPKSSQTLLLKHFYLPPKTLNIQQENEYYKQFYCDILNELIKYGEIEELLVCENIGDHMVYLSVSNLY